MIGSLLVGGILGFLATLVWAGFGVFVVVVLRPLLALARGGIPGSHQAGEDTTTQPDLTYAASQLEEAGERDGRPKVPAGRRSQAIERARRLQEVLEGARALWVVERPASVLSESRMLQGLGVVVAVVSTNEEASAAVADGGFDVILSDVTRGNGDSGLALVGATGEVPLILYGGEGPLSIPRGTFGLTDRPDELLHLVIDALERHRLPNKRSGGQRTLPPASVRPTGDRLRRLAYRLRPRRHAA